jgi:hypothetical protein
VANGGLTNLCETEKQATNRIHVYASRGYKKFCQWTRQNGHADKDLLKWLALLPLAFGWPTAAHAALAEPDADELPSVTSLGSGPQPVNPIGGYTLIATLGLLTLPLLVLILLTAKGCADDAPSHARPLPSGGRAEVAGLLAPTRPAPAVAGDIGSRDSQGQRQDLRGASGQGQISAGEEPVQPLPPARKAPFDGSATPAQPAAGAGIPASGEGSPPAGGSENLVPGWRRLWDLLVGAPASPGSSANSGSWWGGAPSQTAAPSVPSTAVPSSPAAAPDGGVPADAALPSDLAGGTITRQLGPENCKDIWTTNVYSHADDGNKYPGGGRDDFELRVGGWGDLYWSLIQFDLAGLPKVAKSVTLELFDHGDDGTPTEMYLDRIIEFWDWRTQGTGRDRLRLWWADRPATTPWRAAPLPPPVRGQRYVIDITDMYNTWMAGTYPNYGIQLRPRSNMNNFNEFDSSNSPDLNKRPRLTVTY